MCTTTLYAYDANGATHVRSTTMHASTNDATYVRPATKHATTHVRPATMHATTHVRSATMHATTNDDDDASTYGHANAIRKIAKPKTCIRTTSR